VKRKSSDDNSDYGSGAKELRDYGISEAILKGAIQDPDNAVEDYGGGKIYQKKLNG